MQEDDAKEDRPKPLQEADAKKDRPKPLREADFETYLAYVEAQTECGKQIGAKDLFFKLGCQKQVNTDQIGGAVVGQYKLAKSRQVGPGFNMFSIGKISE